MKATYELRVDEEYADRIFPSSEGKKLGSVRLIKLDPRDPRIPEVIRLQRHMRLTTNHAFFYGWDIIRQYTEAELEAASLFFLQVQYMFEPAADECGTVYDDASACRFCGAGAELLSPLRLDLSRIGKTRRIARALSGEIVVERTLADALLNAGVPAETFRPVYSRGSALSSTEWQQLLVPVPSAEIATATRFGPAIFATDEESRESRCPLGHVLGVNILSEVFINRSTYGGEAVAASTTFVGHRMGYLRPERMLFISPAVRRCLEQERVKGIRVEVAHLT